MAAGDFLEVYNDAEYVSSQVPNKIIFLYLTNKK